MYEFPNSHFYLSLPNAREKKIFFSSRWSTQKKKKNFFLHAYKVAFQNGNFGKWRPDAIYSGNLVGIFGNRMGIFGNRVGIFLGIHWENRATTPFVMGIGLGIFWELAWEFLGIGLGIFGNWFGNRFGNFFGNKWELALQRHLCYNQANNRLFTGFSEDAALDYQMLNSVWELKLKYERETRRLEDLRFFAHPSAPPLDGMPHAPAQSSKVEKLATLIVDAERSLTTIAEQIETQKFRLLSLLNQSHMEELPQRVISYRYVGCQSFNAIAKLLHYTRQYILRLHDKGLHALSLDGKEMMRFRTGLRIAQCCS